MSGDLFCPVKFFRTREMRHNGGRGSTKQVRRRAKVRNGVDIDTLHTIVPWVKTGKIIKNLFQKGTSFTRFVSVASTCDAYATLMRR